MASGAVNWNLIFHENEINLLTFEESLCSVLGFIIIQKLYFHTGVF